VACIPVDEWGEMQDLDGAGFLLDDVWHTIDLDTGTVLNEELKRTPYWIPAVNARASGDYCLVAAFEGSHWGQDLNGDGDTEDTVLFARNVNRVERLQNTGLTTIPLQSVNKDASVGNGYFLLELHEGYQSQDLNGDGDAADELVILARFE